MCCRSLAYVDQLAVAVSSIKYFSVKDTLLLYNPFHFLSLPIRCLCCVFSVFCLAYNVQGYFRGKRLYLV